MFDNPPRTTHAAHSSIDDDERTPANDEYVLRVPTGDADLDDQLVKGSGDHQASRQGAVSSRELKLGMLVLRRNWSPMRSIYVSLWCGRSDLKVVTLLTVTSP